MKRGTDLLYEHLTNGDDSPDAFVDIQPADAELVITKDADYKYSSSKTAKASDKRMPFELCKEACKAMQSL